MLLRPSHQPGGSGTFHQAHDFVVNNPLIIDGTTNDNFLKEFAQYTLRGAEFDSSERDPPPKCQPGTRKKIVERIQFWFRNLLRTIMQTLAEIEVQRSMISTLFLSATQRRSDPHKAIATLTYRIAVHYSPYHKFFRSALAADPKLMEKSIKMQFSALIVPPSVKLKIYTGSSPLIIFIDGSDKCEGKEELLLFLALISYFTKFFPESPLLWLVASRPEEHITAFLARRRLRSCYDKEEVSVDSTEASPVIVSKDTGPADNPYEVFLTDGRRISQERSWGGFDAEQDERASAALCFTQGASQALMNVKAYTEMKIAQGCCAYLGAMANAFDGGMNRDSTYLWILPMFHAAGWTYPWASVFACAKQISIINHPHARRAPQQITSLVGGAAPTASLVAGLEKLGIKPAQVYGQTALQLITSLTGGATPTASLVAGLEKLGIKPAQVYGQTEVNIKLLIIPKF
ncbi:Acetate/butyrate--CoA ligase AAE7, peroxisomal [Leucoagaricus sp. SymC.cos]|nr:Acetate/butyrate--CoA ligase AAE7, peroxisomal [Leucoagaricus sp. SymC.cos]